MSAAATKAWKQRNPERVREINREHMRRRRAYGDTESHIAAAYAQYFSVPQHCVYKIGTAQLCLCRSDEARRILLKAEQAASRAGQIANKSRRKVAA